MLKLDRQSHVPLYLQIVEQIQAQVADGTLKAGDRIPSTREMADEYELHRNTVCTAFAELTANGIISSHVGKGTFILQQDHPKKPPGSRTQFSAHVWDRLLARPEKEDIYSQ